MTERTDPEASFLGRPRTVLLAGALAVLVVGYVVMPTPSGEGAPWLLIAMMAATLVGYVLMAVWAVFRLSKSRHPIVDGLLLLITMATFVVFSFATMYLSLAARDPSNFTQPLSKMGAVYFAMTVLSTVGFGDITATTDSARAVVVVQMVFGITLLSIAVQIVTTSMKGAVSQKISGGGPRAGSRRGAESTEPG